MDISPRPPLSPDETRRYARQIVLRGIGGAGQQNLKAARVLVVGAGALGSPAIAQLAGAGIGTLGIADHDSVALSNLHRQFLHGTADIGGLKTESAAAFVAARNPHVRLELHGGRVDATTAPALVAGYDVVLDGTDALDTRRILARAASAAGKPLVSGAVSMLDGHVTVFAPSDEPWPRGFLALYPEDLSAGELPTCEAVGVLGPVTGTIGTLMAMEAIKLVTGLGAPLIGRLLLYDGENARFTEIAL